MTAMDLIVAPGLVWPQWPDLMSTLLPEHDAPL